MSIKSNGQNSDQKVEIIIKSTLLVTEIFYLLRVYLRFTGASPIGSGFTTLIYSLSGPFPLPFVGVISSSINDKSVIEWSTILAMIIYAISAWVIIEFFQFTKFPNHRRSNHLVHI